MTLLAHTAGSPGVSGAFAQGWSRCSCSAKAGQTLSGSGDCSVRQAGQAGGAGRDAPPHAAGDPRTPCQNGRITQSEMKLILELMRRLLTGWGALRILGIAAIVFARGEMPVRITNVSKPRTRVGQPGWPLVIFHLVRDTLWVRFLVGATAIRPITPTENTMTKLDGATVLQPLSPKTGATFLCNSQKALIFRYSCPARAHTDGNLVLVIRQSGHKCLARRWLYMQPGNLRTQKRAQHDLENHSDQMVKQPFCNQSVALIRKG